MTTVEPAGAAHGAKPAWPAADDGRVARSDGQPSGKGALMPLSGQMNVHQLRHTGQAHNLCAVGVTAGLQPGPRNPEDGIRAPESR